jgi:hypothetical protein
LDKGLPAKPTGPGKNNDTLSRKRLFRCGVPQGAVLSPTLYNLYTADLPLPIEPSNTGGYADDIVVWHQSPSSLLASEGTGRLLNTVDTFSNDSLLTINPDKSEVILFTPDTKEFKFKPELNVANSSIDSTNSIVYLGVRFDTMNHFHLHARDVVARANTRCQALNAPSGATWGPTRDDLRQLFQAFVLPVVTYGLGGWGAQLSSTSTKKLESCILRGCRSITGLHRSTPSEAVHIEANINTFETTKQRAVLRAHERSLRLPRSNPRRALAEKQIPVRLPGKLCCRSWSSIIISDKEELRLANNRLDLVAAPIPPWDRHSAHIFPNLTDNATKASPADQLLRSAVETIQQHQPYDRCYYTDGSATDGTKLGGSGVVETTGDPSLPSLSPGVSDHEIVNFALPMYVDVCSKFKTIRYRRWKAVNLEAFRRDVAALELQQLNHQSPISLESTLDNYYQRMSELADQHAPERTKRVRDKPDSPWFDGDCREKKTSLKRLEEHMRGTREPNVYLENRRLYLRGKREYQKLCQNKQNGYFRDRLNSNSTTNKWPIINEMLFKTKSRPDTTCSAADFSTHFSAKITRIRSNLAGFPVQPLDEQDNDVNNQQYLSTFDIVTAADVANTLRSRPNKQCSLDPTPMAIVKDCIDILSPFYATVINSSLELGTMPLPEKRSLVTPLIKKYNLDSDDMNNYRPISNLSIISKLIEHCVSRQLSTHFNVAPLPISQSAYRPYHSTETALLGFLNDVRANMATGQATAAVCLDMSAAFDTVDHEILLRRMKSDFSVNGTCLQWFRSYLSDRTHRVVLGESSSVSLHCPYGVPQGSVLGPILFSIYTSPLHDIITQHGCKVVMYADDIAIFITFDQENSRDQLRRLQEAIDAVSVWLHSNLLQLNGDKTEFIIFAKNNNMTTLAPLVNGQINVDGHILVPSASIKYLGVILDNNLTMKPHISETARTSMWQLREIRRIRARLDRATIEIIIRSFVMSRID